ncbi:hypothetical protein RI138_27460 [Streptomyces sp. C11-1]|uniref:Lipoprotein n=1 Tax=Streptomyces durocortorensis TaxID=2811104 RepID=A0ABY9W5J2_9ACTN|nr:hypothetical protein [Streptomyces durocortorensis]WNF31444.1 hypothetical protein RI138_27460 [Streptomyces durocortorensis]
MPLLLTGCTADTDTPGAERSNAPEESGRSTEAGTGPSAEAPYAIQPDPARLPKTRAAALDLIGRVIADPGSFGPGVVKRNPYESGPATWAVLGTDCVWQQRKPAAHVLATLTRSFEVPAEAGKGPLRLAAVVTVHRTREDAAWEMAESIEESMRCPTQHLRAGERIASLVAGALLGGEANQNNSEDFLNESGEYRSAELGGPHPYAWQQAQVLQFTVAVTGKGAKGRTAREVDTLVTQAQAAMLVRLESAVEKQS